MRSRIHTPSQLPIAPRPIPTELLSSWLLRVAAANQISLRELLDAFECQHGSVLTNELMDYAIPPAAVRALSRFCRVEPGTVRMLDLRERLPLLTPTVLLRFQNAGSLVPRHVPARVRYSFCPLCLVDQKVAHVRWDWSLSCLIRCAVHRRPLLEGCSTCGEPDPLTFTNADAPSSVRCRSCDGYLVESQHQMDDRDVDLQTVEAAYRTALSGMAPGLLAKATHDGFRLFVEEMFDLLTASLNGRSGRWPATFSRRDVLEIVASLILNAAPRGKKSARWPRRGSGTHLWATVVDLIPEYVGTVIEKNSIRWPAALRRGFLSGLHYRTRKRSPCTPYRSTAQLGKPAERAKIAKIYGLKTAVSSANVLSSI